MRYLLLAAAFAHSVLAQTCSTIDPAFSPTWGSGFSGRVVMNDLSSPRGLIFDTLGNLLVVESGGNGVRYVKLQDHGGTDVCVASSKQLIPERGVSLLRPAMVPRSRIGIDRIVILSSTTASPSPRMGRHCLSLL
jgi:hypothetical protein